MVRKLPFYSNSRICLASLKRPLLTMLLLLMGPAGNLIFAQPKPQQKLFEAAEESLIYDFDACRAFSNDNSSYEYHEFTSVQGNSCATISSGQLYRTAGKHSCTDDEKGNAGDAACFQSSTDAYFTADHDLAIRFDVNLSGLENRSSRLDGISFKQLAPKNYLWSAEGLDSRTGPNNYPTKFGIRVLKDNVEIYAEDEIATTQSWETTEFNFNDNVHFEVAEGANNTFTFELISYAPVGNGAAVSAWDLDGLKIFSSCEVECNLEVDAGEDVNSCENEPVTLTAIASGAADCPTIVSKYKITDASTEGKSCFPTWGTGVVYQRGNGCVGSHHIWSAGDDLVLNEYDNETAKITGTVHDQNGKTGLVNIDLFDKAHSGNTWNGQCYINGISNDPRTFYQSFSGTITVDGQPLTVEVKADEQHYILADGAGFEQDQYGLGAWTGGSFGDCTEWFGNLEQIAIDNSNNDVSYLWSNGETTPSITVTESGSYTVTVSDCAGCKAIDTVEVNISEAKADAGDDETICIGDTTSLMVTGEGTYLWSTGETTQSIEVSPDSTSTYGVTVTNGHCEATDEVIVTVENKVVIGDYVWMDENRNGIQDDGATGINDISVKLFHCDGNLVDMTTTDDNVLGEAGYYQFEVCPNSGEYYIVFGDTPEGLEFTTTNTSDTLLDSNADTDGNTACFVVSAEDDLSIDAGLTEICNLKVDAGEEETLCTSAEQIVELTATIEDSTDECPGGCVYPILEQERCFGPTGTFEIWLNSKGGLSSWAFTASEQRFERLTNGDARYTATASNGVDTIEMDVTFSGYTTTPTLGSPKKNECQEYDTADWEYWTTWTGTITSENHGVYTMAMMGAPFQMGVGADVNRTGFGASGWFSTEGGDGYYSIGDVNIPLAECQENGVEYKWTTEDGNIVGDPYKKTISVDAPGTYVFEAMNCIDCFTTDYVVVKGVNCAKSSAADNGPKMSKVYPIPVRSGGTLTIEFDRNSSSEDAAGLKSVSLTSSIKASQNEEDINVVVYDMTGRIISIPRTFKMVNGKAVIYLDIDSIPTGKYIVRAQGNTWSDSKNILVK